MNPRQATLSSSSILRLLPRTALCAIINVVSRTVIVMCSYLGFVVGANAACPLLYCLIDLDFAAGSYSGCAAFNSCIKFSRSTAKWARWQDGHYSAFEAQQPAITDLGILVEPRSTNFVRYSRDLTNSVWQKDNIAAAGRSVGADNAVDSATTLVATKPDGIISQAIAFPKGPGSLSLFLRRRHGTGRVSISYDGGASFMPCALTREFQRFSTASDVMENPNVAIRLEAEGDSIDVDFVQLEGQRIVTSPILTEAGAPVIRDADSLSLFGNAVGPLNSGTFSFVMEGGGAAPRSSSKRPAEIMGGQTASFFILPTSSKLVMTHHGRIKQDLDTLLGSGISSLLAQGSMAKHFKFAASSSDGMGVSLVADGGAVRRHAVGYGAGHGDWRLGGVDGLYSGFLTRLTIWNSKLDDRTLQSLTKVDIPAAEITDTDLTWTNLSVREKVVINGASYEVQSGIRKEPVTNTYPVQISSGGNYLKFHLFANNSWTMDSSDPIEGSERVELAGNLLGSSARFVSHDVDSIWVADSFYIEEGDPITTDWVTLGQIHDRVDRAGVGPVLGFSLRSGEYLAVDAAGVGNIGKYPIARGIWYNRVFSVKFDQSGEGYIKVWINGDKIADYHGNTGNAQTKYYYWKFGIYRSHAPEYIAVRYANMRIGSGSLSTLIAAPDPIPTHFCGEDRPC